LANFRNTPDLLDGVLRRCGEITSDVGVSPRTSAALLYLNQIHHNIICGGCELEVDVDENWAWAKARRPIILSLTTGITAGTCSLTFKQTGGTFSQAPTDPAGNAISVQGWFLKPTTGPEVYQVANHTAGQTAFSLDASYNQTTSSSLNFYLYQLDYDLITQYIIVDARNCTLDFIESTATNAVLTGTIPQGTYTPSAYCGAVATALNNAGSIGNTYGCVYNAQGQNAQANRTFTVSVTLNATNTNACFSPQGATANYYRSAWTDALGFDFTNYSGQTSYTSTYSLSYVTKVAKPARIYYGTNFWYSSKVGQISIIDPVRFDRDYPMVNVQAGTPECATIVQEQLEGTHTIRLNRYPWATTDIQAMRAEFDYIGEPRDLFNNQYSIPQIPRKYMRVLEYGAAHYLSSDKGDDDRAAKYLDTAQKTLLAMMKDNRKMLEKAGRNFGNVIARPDLTSDNRYFRPNVYGYDTTE